MSGQERKGVVLAPSKTIEGQSQIEELLKKLGGNLGGVLVVKISVAGPILNSLYIYSPVSMTLRRHKNEI